MFEMYERVIKWISVIIAISCMIFLWNVNEQYEISKRYPVKEVEWKSLESYAIEAAKNMGEEDINISKEEIVRRKKDNYKIVERTYRNDELFVKVESNVAEVEVVIPISDLEITCNEDKQNLNMIMNYNEATYKRKATVHHLAVYMGMFAVMAALLSFMLYGVFDAIGIIVVGIISLIKFIVKKFKKQ